MEKKTAAVSATVLKLTIDLSQVTTFLESPYLLRLAITGTYSEATLSDMKE